MRERLLFIPCLLVFSALAFSACGGGSSEESKVEEAIETAAASKDPADCKRLQTRQFTEQVSHEGGGDAVERCEEEAKKGEGFEAATVSSVRIEGPNATARVALRGGTLDGQTVELALVKSGDQWKLDEIVEFIHFDEPKLIEEFESKFIKNPSGGSSKFASCFVKALYQGGKQEIEELLLTTSNDELEGVAKLCA